MGAEILRYKYDPDSRLTNRWSAAKGDTKYKYDAVGNLTNIDYAVSTDVTLQYDPLNRVTNMVDAAGTTVYSYTIAGRLFTEDGPWASDTVTNHYDNGLRTHFVLAQPTGSWTNVFGYDTAKRLTSVTSPAGSFTYTLGAMGGASPLIQKIALPNTSYITNAYDTVARMRFTKLNNSSHTTLDSADYGYNAGNQRVTFTNAAGTWFTNRYDSIGQLTVADSSTASEDRGYKYDAAWNLNYRTNNGAVKSFTVNSKNELTAVGTAPYDYDANGNLTSIREDLPFYEYDDENRLVVIEHDGDGWRTEFTYDGTGRLRQRLEYTGSRRGSWTLESETRYVYDGMRVIQERDGSNVPQVSYTRGTELSGSLEGAGGIGGLLGRSHGYASTNGNWYAHNFYHADGNGNITYLVNSSQTLAASYRYDPFGNTTASSGSLASANVYRFSSKEIQVKSGLYYYGYRFYSPNMQRWPNRDPLEELGFQELLGATEVADTGSHLDGEHNLYAYVGNSPINRVDPLGLAALDFPPIGCDVKVTCKCQLKLGISWAGPEITITDTQSGKTWSGKIDARNGFKADIGPCSVEVKCFVNVDFDKADDCYKKCREKCDKLPGGPFSTLKSKCRTRCFNDCVKKR